MPGRRLNDDERHLLQIWEDPPADLVRPTLRSLEVAGGTGLRGIDALIVPFRYPITAICGPNGAGKSTVLALVALAHHSPGGWFVNWGNPQPHRSGGDRSYYTFSDFFEHGKGETPPARVSVTWRYQQGPHDVSLTFRRRPTRWGRYTKRPEREVDFLPLARILPAHELPGVRKAFRNPGGQVRTAPLDDSSRQRLSFIMGKEYAAAEVQETRRFSFQRCQAGAAYTAFNMGGGESCIIALLYLLQRMPRGGLLVVEEIEAGLHPQAQVRLVAVLVATCLEKQLQIVCSTHSEVILDALPRQGRLLIKRLADGHRTYESPSTRFAVAEMVGAALPELVIYCEDRTAATLIEEALPLDVRRRVRILWIGNGATVIRQGVSHLRSGSPLKQICVLDGDCSQPDIERWITSDTAGNADLRPDHLRLPGDGVAPEQWVLDQLGHQPYREAFATEIRCSVAEAQAHAEAMQVELDHHDIGHTLHERTSLDSLDCLRRTMRSIAPVRSLKDAPSFL